MVDAVTEHEFGAFITLTLDTRARGGQARRAGLQGRHRAAAGGPDARGQGPLRHRGRAHDLRLEDLRAATCPTADAEAVRRAKDAGAIVVGKTLTHEFAWGITSTNPHFPPCRNPWDRERVPGGSSGGSRRRARDRRRRARARHRHRRLDPHPGRVLRRLRPQADLRPDPRHRRLPARALARPRRPDGAHARRRAAVLRGADRRPRAGASRPSGSRSAPTCTLRALEPGIQRAFDDAARALDAFEVALRGGRAHLPRVRRDPGRRGRARARRALSRARATSTARTSRSAWTSRARLHARGLHRGDRRARADPRGASRGCSRRPTCC